MITPKQQQLLRQFFGAFFHQDMDVEFGDPDRALAAAVHQYAADPERRELSRGIEAFVCEHPDDRELDVSLLRELRCEYYPPGNGVSTRSWLLSIAAKLARPSDPC